MIEITADYWEISKAYDCLVCTTNGIVKADGKLVMGAGIALTFAQRFPYMPALLGEHIRTEGNTSCIIPISWNLPVAIASLPTKNHWKNPSDLKLIEQSALRLVELIGIFNIKKILLTWPGCGLGGLSADQVRPIIEPIFDDRFTIASK